MKICIISPDQIWLDTLSISLDVLLECEIEAYNQVSLGVERSILKAGNESILLVDSGIPGVDYWALAEWLGIQFQGKAIILTSTNSYNLCASKMMRLGCYAVLDKERGFAACWRAIQSANAGEPYQLDDRFSPFSLLSCSEQIFAKELLTYGVAQLSERKGISQQAVNKKKLAIYQKLNISSIQTDKRFRLLAKLFQLS